MSLIKLSKLIFINLLVFIFLIVIAETSAYVARYYLERNNVGWLVNTLFIDKNNLSSGFHPCNRMKTHPILSHVSDHKGECFPRDGEVFEQFVYYNDNRNLPAIVALGGSTTSGFYQNYANGYTYPLYLNGLVNEHNFQIINGGIGGYNSTQELLKMIFEVRKLKSNIKVIFSLNGINEYEYGGLLEGKYRDIKSFPFLTKIQEDIFINQKWIDQKLGVEILPNIKSALIFLTKKHTAKINEFSKGEDDFNKLINASERWFLNVKAMKEVAKSIDAKYFVFLQPTLGLEGIQNTRPKNLDSSDAKLFNTLSDQYLFDINTLYKELKNYCKSLDYCFDISDIAPPSGSNYSDIRHHNQNGNKLIALEIFNTLKAADILNPN